MISTGILARMMDFRAVDVGYVQQTLLPTHGVAHTVRFTVEGPTAHAKDPWGNTWIGVSATTKIDRKDYGLARNMALETNGILVGEEITITLGMQFVRAGIIAGRQSKPQCSVKEDRFYVTSTTDRSFGSVLI